VDENGVARPHAAKERLRARMSNFFYSPNVEHVTEDEVRTAWAHRDHTELDAANHGQPAAAIEGSGDEVEPGRDSVQSQSLTDLRD